MRYFIISPEKGADTLLWLISTVLGKDWQDGQYYYIRRTVRTNLQVSAELAQRLWEVSDQLTDACMPELRKRRH